MKRFLKLLALGVSVLYFSISASAAVAIQPFGMANTFTIFLTFSGNTAYCTVNIYGANGTTSIDNCTVTLKESGGSFSNSWKNQSATGAELYFNKSVSPVSQGKTYTLSFSATIHCNGTAENISGSITKTYS